MMSKISSLFVAHTEDRGKGVYTMEDIKKGEVIEVCHLIIIPKAELPIIHKTVLHDYYFLWGEEMNQAAIALGYGSIYNHKLHPNANFILDFVSDTIEFYAIEDIEAGTEITVNYHGEPGADDELWFNVKE
ncbi:MAG TPA: SET domain-containing protein [Saprospiraceae bacterium]|nr:SET domain-containing protein [Saprospiraceae bacterium]